MHRRSKPDNPYTRKNTKIIPHITFNMVERYKFLNNPEIIKIYIKKNKNKFKPFTSFMMYEKFSPIKTLKYFK